MIVVLRVSEHRCICAMFILVSPSLLIAIPLWYNHVLEHIHVTSVAVLLFLHSEDFDISLRTSDAFTTI